LIQDLNTDNNSCAAWIAKFLINRKVEFVFGLQGGHIQPIWDHCYKLGIKIIDVRDEKAAVHMAQAYSYFTGKVGIAMVTAGPGVTNTVTGIANAFLSNIPVLLIGGCAPLQQNNMGPLQDIPHVDILKPVTNYSRTARVPDQIIRELDLAFSYAIGNMGSPGPSYFEVPTDILRESVDDKLVLEDWMVEKKPYNLYPSSNDIDKAINTIRNSKKPLIITGRGALKGGQQILKFINKYNIPYLDTQDSRGLIPQSNPNNIFAARSKAMSEADLVILLGRKLDYQLAFGSPAVFKEAKFIRISESALELTDNRRGFPEILSDPGVAIELIHNKLNKSNFDEAWINNIKNFHLEKIKKVLDKEVNKTGDDNKINPNLIFEKLKNIIDDDFVGIADGGDILSFARVGLHSKYYMDSGTFGCLGVGIPYAIAASKVFKEKKIICITGDGSFGFNAMEIDTAVKNNSNICVIISNNGGWNIEKHDQRLNYGNRVYATSLAHSDYAALAKSLGAYGIRVADPEKLEQALSEALNNTPSVVDVITSSTILSSDATKGLGFVPKYQALDVWDDMEIEFRKK
jgi:acetolactate synthase-1/2/3 large subunit